MRNLKKKNLFKIKDSSEKALLRWSPRVELKMLSSRAIARLTDDWRFLRNIYFTDTISLKFQILATQKSLDTRRKTILVRWFPIGIFDDEWIDAASVSGKCFKKFKVQTLTWKQKLFVRDKLFVKQ